MNQQDRQAELRADLTRRWVKAEPAVSSYVFSAVTEFQDAEDLVQQVAVEAARRFETYDPSRSFEAWVIWLAKSRIIDYYRRSGRDRHVFNSDLLQKIGDAQIHLAERSDGRREALSYCMQRLPDHCRRLIRLRYGEGLSTQTIAERETKKVGAVRIALHRVRNLLAECIRQRLTERGAS